MTSVPPASKVVHPAAVRVGAVDNAGGALVAEPMVVEPGVIASAAAADDRHASILVDGVPTAARLEHHGPVRATLVEDDAAAPARTSVLLLPPDRARGPSSGAVRREVVVDGWQVEIEIE